MGTRPSLCVKGPPGPGFKVPWGHGGMPGWSVERPARYCALSGCQGAPSPGLPHHLPSSPRTCWSVSPRYHLPAKSSSEE